MNCDDHVSEALRLASELLRLAERPRTDCEHDGCLVLAGVVRDCAWNIRQAALRWQIRMDRSPGEVREG